MPKKMLRFMCNCHRTMFTNAPNDTLNNYWSIWMEQGYHHYLEDDVPQSLLWFGNAWDIKQLAIERVVPTQQTVNEFTSNALLVTHQFDKLGEAGSAAKVLQQSWDCLASVISVLSHAGCDEKVRNLNTSFCSKERVVYCMGVLFDSSAHKSFLAANSEYSILSSELEVTACSARTTH